MIAGYATDAHMECGHPLMKAVLTGYGQCEVLQGQKDWQWIVKYLWQAIDKRTILLSIAVSAQQKSVRGHEQTYSTIGISYH